MSYRAVFWFTACFLLLCGTIAAIVFRSGPLRTDPDAAPSTGALTPAPDVPVRLIARPVALTCRRTFLSDRAAGG